MGVTLGAVLGHALCTGLAVLGGRMIAQKISVKTGQFRIDFALLFSALTKIKRLVFGSDATARSDAGGRRGLPHLRRFGPVLRSRVVITWPPRPLIGSRPCADGEHATPTASPLACPWRASFVCWFVCFFFSSLVEYSTRDEKKEHKRKRSRCAKMQPVGTIKAHPLIAPPPSTPIGARLPICICI